VSERREYTTIRVDGLAVGLVVARSGLDGVSVLSAREAEIHDAFRFERRRRDWLAGRHAAKRVLLGHLDEPGLGPADVEILPEESRLPLAYRVLDDGGSRRLPVSVSISHRGGAAAAAVLPEQSGTVGVDLEVMEPRSEALAEDNFTPAERDLMPAEWGIAIVWSLKEAALKAAGLGLSVPATDAEVLDLDVERGRATVRLSGEASSGEPVRAAAWIRLEEPLIVTVAVVKKPGM
jgi:4'-phosphopantetheinyl transferase